MAAREAAVFKAQLAEIAHRYDDMAEAMKSVALMDEELTMEEGNLLTLGYKNMIATRRVSSTILSSNENYKDSRYGLNIDYNRKVEKELSRICDEFCSVLDEHVIPASNSAEDQVYYYKMIGDTYAYRAGANRFIAANKSAFVYQTATMMAELELCGSDPIRLALALNFAVMYYNVFNQPETAFNIAYKALEECFADETKLDRDTAAKSLEIMKNLLNHLILWHLYLIQNEAEENADGKGKANVAGYKNGKANVSGYKNGKANVAGWYKNGKANIAENNNGEAKIAENNNGEANADKNNGEANAENNNGEANAENNNGGDDAENNNGGDVLSEQLVCMGD